MNLAIIRSFIADQIRAKEIVCQRYGVAPNTKAMEWVAVRESIREEYQSNPFADKFYPHGCGLEIAVDGLYIDFDYSREGYADGFDAWRLYVYLMAGDFNNNGPDNYICDRVFDWFEGLVTEGTIVQLDNLYYLS